MSIPSKLDRILREIPKDEWVTAADIGKKSGISPHIVGALIGVHLINKSVERRINPKYAERHYEYKQRIRVERTRKHEPTG